jgi:uncharacterized membrane protein
MWVYHFLSTYFKTYKPIKMKQNLSPFAQWLCMCFAFIAFLVSARMIYSGNNLYLFLVWNLFLAWVPYAISIAFENTVTKNKIIQLLLFCSWLLFFPNALYIVTDIIHVKETEAVPVWFDAILLFLASFTGLALAFMSILNVEKLLQHYFSKKTISVIIISLLFIGSFGVYLGRFQRWNSWDLWNNPLSLATDIIHRFTSPFVHTKTWGVTFLLTCLYAVCWFFIKSFSIISTKKIK